MAPVILLLIYTSLAAVSVGEASISGGLFSEAFASYSTHWLSSHSAWVNFDSVTLSCTGSNIFPVCVDNVSLSDASRGCPSAVCSPSGPCQPTALDTVDFIPPPLLTTSDAHMCIESEDDDYLIPPYYGIDSGIPPLFTPMKLTNLRINGVLRARFGDICKSLGGVTIEFWHIDTRLLIEHSAQGMVDVIQDSSWSEATMRSLSCRGEVVTDSEGGFEIRTTLPPSYGPPRHLNIMVKQPGYETLITRVYFDSDLRLHQLVLQREMEDNFYHFNENFQSFMEYNVRESLNDGHGVQSVLGTDPRVMNISFVPLTELNVSSGQGVRGRYEGWHPLTLSPLREQHDSPSSPVPALNLTGLWADSSGALVRVETQGHLFFATQHPHARTWGSVWGILRGNTISGVDFRASGRQFVEYEKQAELLDTWGQTETIWSADLALGEVLPTDPFGTSSFEGSIEWKGNIIHEGFWRKLSEPEGYRYLKLEITRVGGNTTSGRLIINELEFYEGFLAQTEVPRNYSKLQSPRHPSPLAVMCSTFESQLHHCFKAFDGDSSGGSSWVTKSVGAWRHKISTPQWVILDMGVEENTPSPLQKAGIDRGRRVLPTALRIVCGAGNPDAPEGCPMTFTLYGSNSLTQNFQMIKHVDLYDYVDEDYAQGGRTFYFFDEAPFGRLNGQKCGSCDKPPRFACALHAFDRTCKSQFCGAMGLCDEPIDCPVGRYRDDEYSSEGSPHVHCLDCPAGRFGNVSGNSNQFCSGKCRAGCFCTGGSTVSCQHLCGGHGELFCPPGSGAPLLAGIGEKTLDIYGLASPESIQSRVSSVACSPGHYCVDGVENECPVGTYGNQSYLSTRECTGMCPVGTYCPTGSVVPIVCPMGHYCPDGKTKRECPGGTYGDSEGLKTRECSGKCPLGYYCPEGSIYATGNICPAGRYGSQIGLSNITCTGLCQKGYYCPAGSTRATSMECGSSALYCPEGSSMPIPVSRGYYSIGGNSSFTREDQRICDEGYYCAETTGERFFCPAGTYGAVRGLSNAVGPVFGELNADFCSGLCHPGHYCPEGSTKPDQIPCPAGTYGSEYGLTNSNCTAVCPLGHYCPSGSTTPTKCPPGAFGAYTGLKDSTCAVPCSEELCSNQDISDAQCKEGFYCEEGSSTPVPTECGGSDVFCPKASSAPIPVSPGYYSIGGTSSTQRTDQTQCELGYYCNKGVKIPCPPGVYGSDVALTTPECSALCPAGYYCPTASRNGTSRRCPAGRYGNTTGLANSACTDLCAPGYYCPEGSTSQYELECGDYISVYRDGLSGIVATEVTRNALYCPPGSPKPLVVPPGYYSIHGNSSTRDDIRVCPPGTYCVHGVLRECPAGRYGDTTELSSPLCSGPCRKGFYCPVGSTISVEEPCPRGRYGDREGLGSPMCSGPCQNPHHCEPGSISDKPLPTSQSHS